MTQQADGTALRARGGGHYLRVEMQSPPVCPMPSAPRDRPSLGLGPFMRPAEGDWPMPCLL
eukprot:566208-Alexandrium_andersonii.AAC.1